MKYYKITMYTINIFKNPLLHSQHSLAVTDLRYTHNVSDLRFNPCPIRCIQTAHASRVK